MSRTSDSSNESTRFNELTIDDMLAINRMCDAFERSWQSGDPAQLADFVNRLPPEQRGVGVPELVAIDIDYRTHRGDSVQVSDYQQVYPQLDSAWLDAQIGRAKVQVKSDPADAAMPNQLGDYVIQSELGSGGMGRVYKALHPIMERQVAIKVLHPATARHAQSRRRFEREVQAAARLSHPNIVSAYDAREVDGSLFLVSEFVDGVDLAKRVRQSGPLPPATAVDYARQAARGLSYAHQQGIIHRDIKPGNLMLDQSGTVKVLDLGLARWTSDSIRPTDEDTLTHSDQILGTASYMSPEQSRSPLTVDHRSDIYSLGCTLFCLLSGRAPFGGETVVDTLLAHASAPVPKLSKVTPSHPVPAELETLIAEMMAKDPDERLPTMDAVIERIDAIRWEQQQAFEITLGPQIKRRRRSPGSDGSRTFGVSRRTWVIAAVAVPFIALAATWGRFGGNTIDLDWRSAAASGYVFDGEGQYCWLPDFDIAIGNRPAMIEVIAIPEDTNGPTNLVSWTGDTTLILFRASDQRWGIAHYDGEQSRLVVASQEVRPGVAVCIAGWWDGGRLRLAIDGSEVATSSIDYQLHPHDPSLFVGGVAAGVLPESQGPRFYPGRISAVRVSCGKLPKPSVPSGLYFGPDESVVVNLELGEEEATVTDHSVHRWRVEHRP
ncbi:MAG: protein kinase [Planctomycetota bacterium]